MDIDSLIVSGNWARSSSKKNSWNCPIFFFSIVRHNWDMFTLHHKNAISTQKHFGSNGTRVRQRDVNRMLKSFQWLVLWFERIKDNVDNSTLFWKRMYKLETPYFLRCVRGSDVHCGREARQSNFKTFLCDRKKPCSTCHTVDDFVDRTSSRSLRSSS